MFVIVIDVRLVHVHVPVMVLLVVLSVEVFDIVDVRAYRTRIVHHRVQRWRLFCPLVPADCFLVMVSWSVGTSMRTSDVSRNTFPVRSQVGIVSLSFPSSSWIWSLMLRSSAC